MSLVCCKVRRCDSQDQKGADHVEDADQAIQLDACVDSDVSNYEGWQQKQG